MQNFKITKLDTTYFKFVFVCYYTVFLQNIIANRMFKYIDQYFIHCFWLSCLILLCTNMKGVHNP